MWLLFLCVLSNLSIVISTWNKDDYHSFYTQITIKMFELLLLFSYIMDELKYAFMV